MKNEARFDARRKDAPFGPGQPQYLTRPTSAKASDPRAMLTEAVALHQSDRLIEAEQIYRKILELQPKNYDCLHLLGIIQYQRGAYDDALRLFDLVIKDNPKFSPAYNNRGNVLKQLKRFEDALANYERAISLSPDNADAYNNCAVALYELRRYEEALANCEKAIALSPDLAEAYNNRANILKALRRFEEALESCNRALRFRPGFVDALNNCAVVLFEMRRFDEALECYGRALTLSPDDAEIMKNRGNVLARLRRYREAAMDYDKAAALAPEMPYLQGMRLQAKLSGCDWSNFEAECAKLKSSIELGAPASQPFTLLAIPSDPRVQLKCASHYAADKCAPVPAPLWRGERYRHQKIRVAYVSADLREHPVAVLTAGLFERHDKSRFETTAISIGPATPNAMRSRLRAAFDRFCDAQDMSDADIARLMRDLEVDIAVDLNGYTEGSRQNVFSFRAAPVQVNYLGYAGTLGAKFWDYIVADRFVMPQPEQQCYVEKAVYLPHSFMATDGSRNISSHAPTRTEAGLPETGFVFCNFGNSFKITPDVFDVWMRLLKAVDGSVLWLSSANQWAVENLRAEAERRGVAAERLVFASRVDRNEDHLARHRLADLFLDTSPYNAHASAADALWAELPLLTCAGGTFASRVAGSLLDAIGLNELIANSLDEYEMLATALARDPARLAAVKQTLRRNRHDHPLFDTERFTRHLEAAYIGMWERYQRGEAPESFAVGAVR